jgi:hypothetical protein
MEVERMKFLTFRTIGWRGNEKPSQILEKMAMNFPHLSQEQEEHECKNGSGRGRKKGLKRPVEFSPGSSHQPRLKRIIFSPSWRLPSGLTVPRTISPGWNHQPGVIMNLLSRLVAPTGPFPAPPSPRVLSCWTRN